MNISRKYVNWKSMRIDAKIDRLRDAYNTLDDAKEAIDDINKNQKNMISSDLYQSLWTGSRAQYF